MAQTAGAANAVALNAAVAAKKAGFDALYAQSRAASAANQINSVKAVAGRALSTALGVASIIGTLATAAQLAILTKQVANLRTRQLKFESEQKKFNSEINRIANSALNIARTNRDSIAQNQIKLNEQGAKISNNKGEIVKANNKIDQINLEIAALRNKFDSIEKDIADVNQKVNQAIQQSNAIDNNKINNLNNTVDRLQNQNIQSQKQIDSLLAQVSSFQLSDQQQNQKIKELNETIQLGDVKELVTRTRNLNDKVTKINNDITTLKGSEVNLKSSLQGVNTTLKGSEIKLQSTLDGVNTKLQSGLEVTNKLTNDRITNLNQKVVNLESQVNATSINQSDVKKIVNRELQDINQVNNQQAAQINQKLDTVNSKISALPTITTIALAVGGLDIFRQILSKSNKISPCQAPVLVPPVAAQTQATNATLLGFQGASLAQTTAIQKTVNLTQNIVAHGKYGLQAVQKAADIAWKATHADKALQMLNTVLLVNNALYLGRNIGESLGDAASLVLSSLGIKDSTGSTIDVNAVIGSSIKNWIINRIGSANFAAMEQKFTQSNRTYQATANMYYSLRNILASAEDIAEETGVNVAQIGNALRDSHAVEADSYGYMSEGNRRVNKVFNALEKGDDLADSLYTVTTNTVDIRQESSEFNNERKLFQDLLKAESKLEVRKEERQANRIESLPNIEEQDKLETVDESE